MTLVQYLLDAGPEGGGVTNANSGSTASSLTNSSTSQYAAAMAHHGPFGMRIDCKAASQAFRRWTFSGGAAATNWALSVGITLPSSAPGNTIVLATAATNSDANRLSIKLLNNGNLELVDSGEAHFGTLATGLTWGAKYRVTLVVTGGSTTAGAVVAKVYTAAGTQVGSTFSASNWNLGTDQVNRFNFGVCANSAAAVILGIDSIQLDDGRTTEIPDLSSNTPPTANAGPDQTVQPYATVTLDGSGSTDSDGTITDYAWTQTAGSPVTLTGSGATRTFVAPPAMAEATLIFQLTVTDDKASTDSDTVTITVTFWPHWWHNGTEWKPERLIW